MKGLIHPMRHHFLPPHLPLFPRQHHTVPESPTKKKTPSRGELTDHLKPTPAKNHLIDNFRPPLLCVREERRVLRREICHGGRGMRFWIPDDDRFLKVLRGEGRKTGGRFVGVGLKVGSCVFPNSVNLGRREVI